MPHISVKMLEGRSEEQKKRLAAALVRALTEELHCSDHYVACTVEDYSAVEWQTVFQRENPFMLFIKRRSTIRKACYK